MRASSFSNAKVIGLLNNYFVPVHLNNQECGEKGDAPPEEKAEKNRIYRDAVAAGLKAGTVCAYVVAPDGRPLAAAPLNEKVAADPERLAELLERVVRDLKVAKGEPLARPKPPSPPPAAADALVLHVVARYLERRGGEEVPRDVTGVLGTKKAGDWDNLPSESWVVLAKPQWAKLLPPGDVQVGTAWELPAEVAGKLLTHFYPPTENTDPAKNRLDERAIRARVESVEKGVARARLEGRLKMKHPFYHKDDGNFAEADLVGYLEFDAVDPRVRSLRLVTDAARYGDAKRTLPFGVAVRSVPPAK